MAWNLLLLFFLVIGAGGFDVVPKSGGGRPTPAPAPNEETPLVGRSDAQTLAPKEDEALPSSPATPIPADLKPTRPKPAFGEQPVTTEKGQKDASMTEAPKAMGNERVKSSSSPVPLPTVGLSTSARPVPGLMATEPTAKPTIKHTEPTAAPDLQNEVASEKPVASPSEEPIAAKEQEATPLNAPEEAKPSEEPIALEQDRWVTDAPYAELAQHPPTEGPVQQSPAGEAQELGSSSPAPPLNVTTRKLVRSEAISTTMKPEANIEQTGLNALGSSFGEENIAPIVETMPSVAPLEDATIENKLPTKQVEEVQAQDSADAVVVQPGTGAMETVTESKQLVPLAMETETPMEPLKLVTKPPPNDEPLGFTEARLTVEAKPSEELHGHLTDFHQQLLAGNVQQAPQSELTDPPLLKSLATLQQLAEDPAAEELQDPPALDVQGANAAVSLQPKMEETLAEDGGKAGTPPPVGGFDSSLVDRLIDGSVKPVEDPLADAAPTRLPSDIDQAKPIEGLADGSVVQDPLGSVKPPPPKDLEKLTDALPAVEPIGAVEESVKDAAASVEGADDPLKSAPKADVLGGGNPVDQVEETLDKTSEEIKAGVSKLAEKTPLPIRSAVDGVEHDLKDAAGSVKGAQDQLQKDVLEGEIPVDGVLNTLDEAKVKAAKIIPTDVAPVNKLVEPISDAVNDMDLSVPLSELEGLSQVASENIAGLDLTLLPGQELQLNASLDVIGGLSDEVDKVKGQLDSVLASALGLSGVEGLSSGALRGLLGKLDPEALVRLGAQTLPIKAALDSLAGTLTSEADLIVRRLSGVVEAVDLGKIQSELDGLLNMVGGLVADVTATLGSLIDDAKPKLEVPSWLSPSEDSSAEDASGGGCRTCSAVAGGGLGFYQYTGPRDQGSNAPAMASSMRLLVPLVIGAFLWAK